MNSKTILALLALSFGAAGAAEAGSPPRPCTAAPQAQWLSIDALQAKVADQGYQIRKAKFKSQCGEIYAVDPQGNRVELFVDPTSGTIVDRQ